MGDMDNVELSVDYRRLDLRYLRSYPDALMKLLERGVGIYADSVPTPVGEIFYRFPHAASDVDKPAGGADVQRRKNAEIARGVSLTRSSPPRPCGLALRVAIECVLPVAIPEERQKI